MKPQKKEPVKADLPAEIPEDVARILKDIPSEKRNKLISFLAVSIKQHSGPLPDGETIKIYNDQIPNGGDRLMCNVEKQLDHRIEIEKYGVRRSFNQSGTGQWIGLVISVLFLAASWDLAKSGHEITASVLGGTTVVSLATSFIVGKIKQTK